MKVEQLIELLQGVKEDHGNVEVKVGVSQKARTVTGIWVRQLPKSPDRFVALSTGEAPK